VSRTADFAAAFERASSANRSGQPALLELMIDPQAITVNQTLNEIRQQALGAK
jgi:acetolactate synthase-1/2/3 large subunit